MGVFDFVRDVGAKVGIGKSTDEREAEEKAKKGEQAVRDMAAAAQKGSDKRTKEIAADKARAERVAKVQEKHQANVKAERYAEYKKSIELEKYVSDLGLKFPGLDIRYDNGQAYITGEAPTQEAREKVILAVGNAEGVGRVNEEITVAAQAEQAVFHTVESGDTLWAVAEKVYGDGNRYPEIFEANKPMLSDPDLIFPGQVLRCPK